MTEKYPHWITANFGQTDSTLHCNLQLSSAYACSCRKNLIKK